MAANVYQIVTDRIIAELEKGNIPWRKPWTGIRSGAYSHSTGRPYSILNQFMLPKPGEYITWTQIQAEGGRVRKGEKSSIVVFWKVYTKTEKNDKGEDVERNIPVLRYFNVWHIDQCEGIEPKFKAEDLTPPDPIEAAEEISADYLNRSGVKLEHVRGDRACYSPSLDRVTLPLFEQFDDSAEYYSTMFHELGHSTGHKSRLDRFTTGAAAAFGGEDYGKEELVAEITSACILSECGIETPESFKNSAAYVQNWLKAIRGDNKLIVSAASKAEKAVALIMGEPSKAAETATA